MGIVGIILMYATKPLTDYIEKLSNEENDVQVKNESENQSLCEIKNKETQEIYDWVFKS